MLKGFSWRRAIPTCRGTCRFVVLLIGFAILMYFTGLQPVESQAEGLASRNHIEEAEVEASEEPMIEFEATAYCDYGITKSGALTTVGVVAADPAILPMGSVIDVEAPSYGGIYRVLDTGALVKGKIIDIYVPGLEAATAFGRQKVRITVIQYGYPDDGRTDR
jgi:3D (Asp-Asp-Asp) domain-containing protein